MYQSNKHKTYRYIYRLYSLRRCSFISSIPTPIIYIVITTLSLNDTGGNSRTLMIACASPADTNFEETLNVSLLYLSLYPLLHTISFPIQYCIYLTILPYLLIYLLSLSLSI